MGSSGRVKNSGFVPETIGEEYAGLENPKSQVEKTVRPERKFPHPTSFGPKKAPKLMIASIWINNTRTQWDTTVSIISIISSTVCKRNSGITCRPTECENPFSQRVHPIIELPYGSTMIG